jgi:putative transposase
LWGVPRIHRNCSSSASRSAKHTVGGWMPWRPKVPSPTWRTFLRKHLPDLAAIDMFVVATATFRLHLDCIYTLIVLSLDRRRVVHFEVTPNPTQNWLSRQIERGLSLGHCTALSAMGPGQIVWSGLPPSRSRDGHHGDHHCPRSPWQNLTPSVSSVRSAVNAWSVLSSYFQYHHEARTHLLLNKECPQPRLVQLPCTGNHILAFRRLAACIIAMSVEPRKIGEAARCLSLPSTARN